MDSALYKLLKKLLFLLFITQRICESYILNNIEHPSNRHLHHHAHHSKNHRSNSNPIPFTHTSDKSDNVYTWDADNTHSNIPRTNFGTYSSDDGTDGENNPCLTHYCPKGRECEVNAFSNAPECVCQRSCENKNSPISADNLNNQPICGSDGMVYENHCELHRAACILNRPIAFQRLEKCTTDIEIPAKKAIVKKNSTHESDAMQQLKVVENVGNIQNVENDIDTNIVQTDSIGNERLLKKCTSQEYEIMKDNLLLFNHARLMTRDNNHSKDFLVSIMFSHYDQNNNGHLDAEELNQVSQSEQLDELSNGCILRDMIQYDDLDKDQCLSINEFYQAFNKLYSMRDRIFPYFEELDVIILRTFSGVSVVSLDKALETNHLSARVGDNVEIKCDVTGSPAPPIIWTRNGVDLSTLNEEDVRKPT